MKEIMRSNVLCVGKSSIAKNRHSFLIKNKQLGKSLSKLIKPL